MVLPLQNSVCYVGISQTRYGGWNCVGHLFYLPLLEGSLLLTIDYGKWTAFSRSSLHLSFNSNGNCLTYLSLYFKSATLNGWGWILSRFQSKCGCHCTTCFCMNHAWVSWFRASLRLHSLLSCVDFCFEVSAINSHLFICSSDRLIALCHTKLWFPLRILHTMVNNLLHTEIMCFFHTELSKCIISILEFRNVFLHTELLCFHIACFACLSQGNLS